MEAIWDGSSHFDSGTSSSSPRAALADAARAYDWKHVLELLDEHRELANSCRPGGRSGFAPLHQAAYGGADSAIVQRLIGLGAWRTHQNSRGERPVDVAERRGHHHLCETLEPVLRHRVPHGILLKLQVHFHEVIRGRLNREYPIQRLRLPELEPLLEVKEPKMWFPVPGMNGGFSYRLESPGVEAKLVSESWSRVVDGSGQRHEITTEGSSLVEEGFA